MKTFDELYYGYVVREREDSGRYVHCSGDWTVTNGQRLFTKQEAVDFINEHPDSDNLIIEDA